MTCKCGHAQPTHQISQLKRDTEQGEEQIEAMVCNIATCLCEEYTPDLPPAMNAPVKPGKKKNKSK